MTPEERIYGALNGTGAVTALVGTRISPAKRGQAQTLPSITFQRISNVPSASVDGNVANLQQSRVQVDAWASSPAAIAALGTAIYTALATLNGIIESDIDDYDDDLNVYRRIIDFSFWNKPA